VNVVVNGEAREVPDGVTVAGLLIALKLEQQRVAVELNEAVVPRRQHADTTLQPGDRVELVTFVGGG